MREKIIGKTVADFVDDHLIVFTDGTSIDFDHDGVAEILDQNETKANLDWSKEQQH